MRQSRSILKVFIDSSGNDVPENGGNKTVHISTTSFDTMKMVEKSALYRHFQKYSYRFFKQFSFFDIIGDMYTDAEGVPM